MVDPDGNTTGYCFDRLNQQTQTTDPLWNTSWTKYDSVGNVVQTIDANGRVVQYAYNPLNQQVTENWLSPLPPGEGQGNGWISNGIAYHTIQTSYDAADEVRGVTETDTANPSACTNYEYAYDADGDLLTSRMAPGDLPQTPTTAHPYVRDPLVTLNYSYDADGNNTATGEASIASNDSGSTISQSYDALSDLTQVKQAMGGTVNEQVDLTHNSDGSLHTVSRYAGDGTCFVVSSTDLYDADGRLTSLTYSSLNYINSTTFVAPGYTFQYDPAGDVVSSTSAMDGSTTYSNDDADQLSSVTYNSSGGESGAAAATDESYRLDQNGNRTDSTSPTSATPSAQVTGADNRLLWDGTYSYTYDKDGNRITKTLGTGGATACYTWDDRNRLVQETNYNSLADALAQRNATQTVAYTYDAYNNRIRETVTVGGVTTYDYLAYADGSTQPFLGFSAVGGLASSTPLLTDEYLVGDGQVFADYEAAPANRSGQLNASTGQPSTGGAPGAVWILANQDGTACDLAFYSVITGGPWLVTHRVFDSFGALESTTPGATHAGYTIGTNVAYAGMFLDPNTGLQDDSARWYDAWTSQFVSPDPAGCGTNLYTYCGDSPAENVDPSGMCYTGLNMTFADDELDDSTYSLSSTAMLELGGYTNQQLAALASSAGGLNLQSSLPRPSVAGTQQVAALPRARAPTVPFASGAPLPMSSLTFGEGSICPGMSPDAPLGMVTAPSDNVWAGACVSHMPISEQEARIATADETPQQIAAQNDRNYYAQCESQGALWEYYANHIIVDGYNTAVDMTGIPNLGAAADSFQQGNYGEGAGQLAMAYFKMDLLVGGPVAEGVNLTVGAAFEGLGLGIRAAGDYIAERAGAYTAERIGGLTGDLAGEAFGGTMEGLAPSAMAQSPVWSSATGDVVIDGASLPGSVGVQVPRRLAMGEMESLTTTNGGIEFSLVYRTGTGTNGGGGTYSLYSGTARNVSVPLGSDVRWIYHTHPGGTPYASGIPGDQNVLQLLQQAGSPQRSSVIIPVGGTPFRFNINSTRLP